MARVGYLQRIAQRASAAAPALRPPRVIGRLVPRPAEGAAVADAHGPETMIGGAVATPAIETTAPSWTRAPHDAVPRSPAAPSVAAPDAPASARIDGAVARSPSLPPSASPRSAPRSPGSPLPLAPSLPVASPPVAPPPAPPPGNAERREAPGIERGAAPHGIEPQPDASPEDVAPRGSQRPSAPRRAMPRRNVSAQPDPLAMALAAAMRWVATDEEPKAAGRPPTGNAPPPARGEAMIAMVAPPVAAPPPALRPAVRDDPGPAPSRDPASATPDATAGGVHIGSVEIQIVPAHEPPPRPAPAVAPRAVVAPLSRGFTSPIGLRQS